MSVSHRNSSKNSPSRRGDRRVRCCFEKRVVDSFLPSKRRRGFCTKFVVVAARWLGCVVVVGVRRRDAASFIC